MASSSSAANPRKPLLLGLILGPMMGEYLRRALLDLSWRLVGVCDPSAVRQPAAEKFMPSVKKKREEAFVED